ncbi:MAG: isochorismatase family protein [Kofleriaceae bacterium]
MIGLARDRAALVVVDIQDRLVGGMPAEVVAQVVKNTAILIEAAVRFGLPIIVSQQYPKGLGTTVAALETALALAKPHRFDKVVFSTAAAPEFAALAPKLGRDQWIVTGMEAHVCVYQTVRDLVARGYQAHVPLDAVCSRTKANWRIGTSLCERAGGIPTSTEVCVFDLLERAGSEDFKALSKAIR